MKILGHIIVLVCVLCSLPSTGQNIGDWTKLGDAAMADSDPYGAMRYYAEALALDSSKGSLNYKYAQALRANHRYAQAAYYYGKVYSRDYGNLYPNAGMHLAEMLKQSGRYEESKRMWRRVRDANRDDVNSDAYRKAVQEMRACDLSLQWTEQAPSFELQALPDIVNTGDSEFGGVFGPDGSLVFAAMRGTYDDKGRLTSPESEYHARLYLTDSAMQHTSPLFPTLEAAHANYAPYREGEVFYTLMENGRTAIYHRKGKADIRILPIAPEDTANYTQPNAAFVEGRAVLFFASDRKGGQGGFDLWVMDLTKSGAPPVNLGESINTPGNEITPFYRGDTEQLYFSSDWHHGLGGYDIFRSNKNPNGFDRPENLKPPFNSAANDLYYSFDTLSGRGTVTSNRRTFTLSDATCCNDLWQFEEARVRAADSLPKIATLEDLNTYLPVTLYFHNDAPDPRTTSDTTTKDYLETYHRYLDLLPRYERAYSTGMVGSEAEAAEEKIDDFFLNEVDRGVDDLALFTRLLLGELGEGARIDLTIKGFASPLARTDYNVHLANRRIASLVNYLKNYGSGEFIPYLSDDSRSGGALRVVSIPFGEYKASPYISDNPNEGDAVFSIAAARERRIQITSVGRLDSDSALADVVFDREIIDLGTLDAGASVDFAFAYSVEGDRAWVVDSTAVRAAQDELIQTETLTGIHENGTSGIWAGELKPGRIPGKSNAVLILYGNTAGGPKELNLTFEIKSKP